MKTPTKPKTLIAKVRRLGIDASLEKQMFKTKKNKKSHLKTVTESIENAPVEEAKVEEAKVEETATLPAEPAQEKKEKAKREPEPYASIDGQPLDVHEFGAGRYLADEMAAKTVAQLLTENAVTGVVILKHGEEFLLSQSKKVRDDKKAIEDFRQLKRQLGDAKLLQVALPRASQTPAQ